MWLKVIIVLLFIALLVSLVSGFSFLIKDQGSRHKTRLWSALNVRIVLTVALIGFVVYGIQSGNLRSQAPWGATTNMPASPTTTK